MGAGDLRWTKELAKDHRLTLIAVDKRPCSSQQDGFVYLQKDIGKLDLHWKNVSGFLYKNVIQFLERDTAFFILKKAFNSLKSGGVIAIETFFDQPDPSFDNKVTTFSLTELRNFFLLLGATEIHTQVSKNKSTGLDGTDRVFSIVQIIVSKK